MGLNAKKPVFGVSDNVRFKPVSSATETSKSRYDTFQLGNNKGADQTERMHRLVCNFVGRKPPKTGFLSSNKHTVLRTF